MRQSIAIMAMLATLAATTDVVSFFIPGGFDGPSPIATINSAASSTTKMRLACPTGVSLEDCGWGTGVDYTIISGTHYEAATSSISFGCDYQSQASNMVCSADVSGQEIDQTTLSGTDVAFATATVVEGASLLSGGSSSASATPAPKSTSSSITLQRETSSVASSTASNSPTTAPTPTAQPTPAQQSGVASHVLTERSVFIVMAGIAVANLL